MLEQAQLHLDGIKEILAIQCPDERQEAIYDYPLEVAVRSGWYSERSGQSNDPQEYRVLLCVGGPTLWITGELGFDGTALTARLEGRDYGAPLAFQSSDPALLEFAKALYSGS